MYHFLHKHRYWFLMLVVATAAALFYFQTMRDDGAVPGPINGPNEPVRAIDG